MFCYCNNVDVVSSDVLYVRSELGFLGEEILIKTVKYTLCCLDCGSIFYDIREETVID